MINEGFTLFITQDLWQTFQPYLTIEKKMSDKKSNLWALKSRFNKVAEYFSDTDFNKQNFNVFIAKMKASKYAPSHLNNIIKIAKHLDKFLEIYELQDYGYFRESYTQIKDVLTPEEIKQLAEFKMKYKFTQFMNHRQKALIYLMGTTGCRIGELISLKWDDLYSDKVIFRETKNGDTRAVPISADLYELLSTLPKKRQEVFSSYRGNKLSSQETNSDLQKRAKQVGITKHVYNHLFRHSFITTMLEQGADSLDVAVIVGHKDPRNTMKYKNSLISHYQNVVQVHPLLKKNLSFEQMTKNIRKLVYKSVNISNCNLSMREENGRLIVKMERT